MLLLWVGGWVGEVDEVDEWIDEWVSGWVGGWERGCTYLSRRAAAVRLVVMVA